MRVVIPGMAPLDVLAEPGHLDNHHECAATLAGLSGLVLDEPLRAACAPVARAHAGTTVHLDGDGDGDGDGVESASAWELLALDGDDAGRVWPLVDGSTTLGRAPDTDIRLRDRCVSHHHCRVDVADTSCTITDLDSANGTLLDDVSADTGASIAASATEAELRIGTTRYLVVRRGPDPRVGRDGRVAHNRPPRAPTFIPPAVRVLAPPLRPARLALSVVGALVPLIIGIAMWLMFHNPVGLLLGLGTPVALGAQWWIDRRRGRRHWSTSRAEYRAHLAAVRADCLALADRWRASAAAQFPDPARTLHRARRRDPRCWDRRPGDADFGRVRVAALDTDACLDIGVELGGAPELRAEANRIITEVRPVAGIPVTVSVTDGPIGIAGEDARASLIWMTVALAATHSPRDIRIAVCAGDDPADRWAFAAWLPHTAATPLVDASTLCGRSRARSDALLAALAGLVDQRRRAPRPTAPMPRFVVVVPDVTQCDPATVARIAELGIAVNVHLMVGAGTPAALPGTCTTIMTCGEQHTMLRTPDGRTRTALRYDSLAMPRVMDLACALAGMRDASTGSDATHLPSAVRLADCLDSTDRAAILRRWQVPPTEHDLAAPIGIGLDGPLTIDLRAHGPHALIAGTTGSGKSVLLQTLVAAFAASHAPERLAFVLIDYKGGAAFGPCVAFPHVAGLVTDLDEGTAHRVLLALEAELRHREAVLRDADVPDLAAMEAAGRDDAPPNLCIVIDEFAALIREVPSFIDGIVDLAQRGRSLGMHLVLATQKPAGVVNDRIRANAALRIALRTTDVADSTDILGVADAAHLPRCDVGRAIVSFGPNERMPFQSAHATAPASTLTRRPLRPLDTGRALFTAEPEPEATGDETDLDRVVTAVQAAATHLGAPRARCPWQAPLPKSVALASLSLEPGGSARCIAIGQRDEPSLRAQPVHTLDLHAIGAVLISGGAGRGKSTALITIAAGFAARTEPSELQVAVLHDGSGALQPLGVLPHVTAQVALHDPDDATRYLTFLERELDQRRSLLRSQAAVDWDALGEDAPPRVLILLDGLGTFLHSYERVDGGRWYDLFLRVVRESRACGVHWCLTTDQRAGLPPALAAHTTERIELGGDADGIGRHLDEVPRRARVDTAIPGRARVQGREVQLAHVGAADDIDATLAALLDIGADVAVPATPIAPYVLPEVLSLDPDGSQEPLVFTLGRTEYGDAALLDLRTESLLVCGPRGSGRSTLLDTLAAQAPAGVDLVRISGAADNGRVSAALNELLLDQRADGAHRAATSPTLVLVDDADLLTDGEAATTLEALAKLGSRGPVRLVVACDMFTVTRSYAPWVGELKRSRRAVLLQPSIANDGDAFAVRLRARPGCPFPPGRGFLVERGEATLIQCAVPGVTGVGG